MYPPYPAEARDEDRHNFREVVTIYLHPQDTRPAATRSRASWEGDGLPPPEVASSAITANTRVRPSASTTMPAIALRPLRVPVFARTWPAADAPVVAFRYRSRRVPEYPPTGRPATSTRPSASSGLTAR